jgi:hypothetical protein
LKCPITDTTKINKRIKEDYGRSNNFPGLSG